MTESKPKPKPKPRPRNRRKKTNRPPQQQAQNAKSQDILTAQQREEMAKRAKARADLYEIYSLLFQEMPSIDLLAVFRHSDFMSIIDMLLSKEVAEKWRKFASSKTPLDHVQHRLRLEYNSLFLLPTSHRVVLRESFYFLRPGKSPIPQRRIDSLLKFYRRIGMTPMAKFKDQPDHFSQVMHFMSVLCEREKDHLQKKNNPQLETICQIQLDFLQRHLSQWIPLFREKMFHSTRFVFFRDIAETLEAFLVTETEWITGQLERYGLRKPRKEQGQSRKRSARRPAKKRPQGKPEDRPKETEKKPKPEKKEGGEGEARKPRRRRRRRPRRPGGGGGSGGNKPQSSPQKS